MKDDYLENLYDRFTVERQKSVQGLFSKFKGLFRAQVVDTNDPLNMRRVRVKIPEFHKYDLDPKECPWAIVANWSGGQQCGSFHSYAIDDIVFVLLEKNHPYSPVIVASADATRRARYPIDSVYHDPSPDALDLCAKVEDPNPPDHEKEWMPKDKRPMSMGMKDRYGHLFLMNAVGFFPKEHEGDPADPGMDRVNKRDSNFQKGSSPQVNDPDSKHIVLMSKYGNFILFSDAGYDWKKEFDGEWESDRGKERDRSKYYTKHWTEQEPKDRDQRRIEIRTRCGHMYEMRDVGWKTARADDPWVGGALNTGSKSGFDERWLKLRSKGSHLIQIMDSGFDEVGDNKYKELNKDQYGGKVDDEESFWKNQDARQIRLITRHGFKLILDDRGSDETKAEEDDTPHGNGLLIKGKRKAGGVKRGFGIEFNEKDEMNKLALYTPRSQVFEMNDKHNYIIICTALPEPISEEWQWKKDNEFARKPVRNLGPEQYANHLVMDDANEYIRFKTAGQQGIEFRDGGLGPGFECEDDEEEGSGSKDKGGFDGERLKGKGNKDGCRHKTWGIMEDKDKRAFFMSHDEEAIVIHSCECCETNCNVPIPAMWLIFDEKGEGNDTGIWTKHTEPNTIILQNLCNKIKVYAVNDIEFHTDTNFRVKANENIEFRADKDIIWRAERDVKGSSNEVTHHWSGKEYKIKSKDDYYVHAINRITNKAGTTHCIDADLQASVLSRGVSHVTEGPGGTRWVVGNGKVGTTKIIHAPMIIAVNGPGPQAHVTSGSSVGDHPVGTPSFHDGIPCPAVLVPHEIRIPESDNEYQRPEEDRFIVCGRKKTGNGEFTPTPLSVLRGNPGSPVGATPGGGSDLPPGVGNPDTPVGNPDTPEPPPPPPPPQDPPPPPPPSGTIKCYQAIGFVLKPEDPSDIDWQLAREECNNAPITDGDFGGLQISNTIIILRGGCSINTTGIETLQIEMLVNKESELDIAFNIIYSYQEPVIGADFNSWYSIGQVDTTKESWLLDVTPLVPPANNGTIYFAAVAKSDRFSEAWPVITDNDENWFCRPTLKFIINGKSTE